MKVLVVISAVLAVAAAGNLGFAYSAVSPYHSGLHWNGLYNGAYPYAAHAYSSAVLPYHGAHVAAPYAYSAAPFAYHGVHGTQSQYHAQDVFGQASYGHVTHNQAHSAVRDAFGGVTGSYSYVNPAGKLVETHYTADDVHGFRVASNDLPVGPAVPAAPVYPELVGPEPVQDTPEVVAARAEHFAAHAEAKSRSRRQAILATPLSYSHSTLYHPHSALATRLVSPVAYNTLHTPLVYRHY